MKTYKRCILNLARNMKSAKHTREKHVRRGTVNTGFRPSSNFKEKRGTTGYTQPITRYGGQNAQNV
jgi:hypothetical protein